MKVAPAVIVLGLVSFLTDISSEMIYPLLPLYLTGILGASAGVLGLIEGVAEATASLFKVFSGAWSDRVRKRKPYVLGGYALAAVARPLVAVSTIWPQVLGIRFFDRVGKGIRTAPRDALIADVTSDEHRATAFGLQRSMDHAGAVMGPLIATILLSVLGVPLKEVFLFASIPGVLAVILLWRGVKEKARTFEPEEKERFEFKSLFHFRPQFRWLAFCMFIFFLGNSSDAFLLLRFSNLGVSAEQIALLWSAHHVVKMTSTYYGGRLADRIGRRRCLFYGMVFYAAIYFCFATVSSLAALLAVFLGYGIFYGLSEPSERALVAHYAGSHQRASAMGLYHFIEGLALLPASLIFGLVWDRWGAGYAFSVGGMFALAGATIFYFKFWRDKTFA